MYSEHCQMVYVIRSCENIGMRNVGKNMLEIQMSGKGNREDQRGGI